MTHKLSHVIIEGLPCPPASEEALCIGIAYATRLGLNTCIYCNQPLTGENVQLGVWGREYGTALCVAHEACAAADTDDVEALRRLDGFASFTRDRIEKERAAAEAKGAIKH